MYVNPTCLFGMRMLWYKNHTVSKSMSEQKNKQSHGIPINIPINIRTGKITIT
jgi:hypothetical protein